MKSSSLLKVHLATTINSFLAVGGLASKQSPLRPNLLDNKRGLNRLLGMAKVTTTTSTGSSILQNSIG